LDLPPPSSTSTKGKDRGDGEEGLAAKKLRLDGPKKSGLAGMLPPPKNGPTGGAKGRGGGLRGMLPPPSNSGASRVGPVLGKAKANEAEPHALASPPPAKSPKPEPASTTYDFFNLAPSTSTITLPSSSAASSISISSAPQVTEAPPPPPSLYDPYPGYYQHPVTNAWIQRDPATDPLWAAFYQEHYAQKVHAPEDGDAEVPKGFGDATEAGCMESFNAAEAARKAFESRPEIINPKDEARAEEEAKAEGKPQVRFFSRGNHWDERLTVMDDAQKMISGRAKGRHQLTALLSDAQANRAELEERIARGKANRKAGGSKYGTY